MSHVFWHWASASDKENINTSQVSAKRLKQSTLFTPARSQNALILTKMELEALPVQSLVDHAIKVQIALETALAELESERAAINALRSSQKAQGTTSIATAEWSEEKVREKASKLADMCAKEIKKQMKWQVSQLSFNSSVFPSRWSRSTSKPRQLADDHSTAIVQARPDSLELHWLCPQQPGLRKALPHSFSTGRQIAESMEAKEARDERLRESCWPYLSLL